MRPIKLVAELSLSILATMVLSSCSMSSSPSSIGSVPSSFNPGQRSGPGWLNDTFVGTDHPNMVYDAKYALYMVNLVEEGAAPFSSLSNAYLSTGVVQDAQNVATKELNTLKGAKIKNATFVGIRRSEHVTVKAVENTPGRGSSSKSKDKTAASSHASSTTATTTETSSAQAQHYIVSICFYSGWSAVKGGSYVAAPGYYLTAATMEPAGTHRWELINANPKSISGPTAC